nr:LamG-like jellyroll fold domain-containing protein [uncultured Agathobaculum sp.]
MSKPHFMKKGLAALLAFSVVASAGGSALAAGVPVADAAGEEGVYQTAPDTEVRPAAPSVAVTAPESGLRFDSVKQEYAEMSDTVAIPQTAEIWVNLDPGENRRQIIFNNYQNGTEDSWGLEVTVDNTLRYWERVDGTQTSLLFDDVEICTGEWMLVSVVRDLDSGKVLVYINDEYVTEQDASNLNDGTQLTHALRFGTDTRSQLAGAARRRAGHPAGPDHRELGRPLDGCALCIAAGYLV